MSRRSYLISYDVSNDKRRIAIYRTLLDYGDHVQYSVFICELNDCERIRLRGLLKELVNGAEDHVIILDLGSGSIDIGRAFECIGQPYVPLSRVQVV